MKCFTGFGTLAGKVDVGVVGVGGVVGVDVVGGVMIGSSLLLQDANKAAATQVANTDRLNANIVKPPKCY